MNYFARNLRLFRVERGLSQAEVAARARIAQARHSELERGMPPHDDDKVRRLSGALEVSVDDLTSGDVVIRR